VPPTLIDPTPPARPCEPTGASIEPGVAFPRSDRDTGDNTTVRTRDLRLATNAGTVLAACGMLLLTGCQSSGATATPADGVSHSATPAAVDPRALLAARAAAAKDRRYMVGYTLTGGGRTRSVLVTMAADGTWRVDIQGGALSGGADIAVASRSDGLYQCALMTLGGCVRVAAPGKALPAQFDPTVQYPFTAWLDVLTDRQVSMSVTLVDLLPGATGTCFGIEPAVTALRKPIDPGVLCFAEDGTLTSAKLPFGTLTIAGAPTPPPPTAPLPGPVVQRAALPITAPPQPSGSPAVSPSR
jgi:hypothetical protein